MALPRPTALVGTCSQAWTCSLYPRMAPSEATLPFLLVLGGRRAVRLWNGQRPYPTVTGLSGGGQRRVWTRFRLRASQWWPSLLGGTRRNGTSASVH